MYAKTRAKFTCDAFGIDAPPLLTWCPNLDHLLCSGAKLTHAMKKHLHGRERERTEAIKTLVWESERLV